jgi:hypothetical protein
MIFTTDDLCLENLEHFRHWDWIKSVYPDLKLLAFTIANKDGNQNVAESKEFRDWYEDHKDWVEIGVHGWDHGNPPEQERDDAEELVAKSLATLEPFLPEHPIYRPPGFQRTLKTEPMLKRLGFAGIAYQNKIRYFNGNILVGNVVNSHCCDKYVHPITKWREWLNPAMFENMSGYEPIPDKEVFIGIPNRGNMVTELALNLGYWQAKYSANVYAPYGLFPLDNARNTIVKEFLETNCKYLWWIDDDIVPPPDTLERLMRTLEISKDIHAIGAVCFSMKSEPGQYFPYPPTLRMNADGEYEVYYGEGVDLVDATGGACVLVRREVYEAIERPYEFKYHADGTLALTCDFYVWQKAKEAGFNLCVDFDILCDHNRTCSLKGIQDAMAKMQIESERKVA